MDMVVHKLWINYTHLWITDTEQLLISCQSSKGGSTGQIICNGQKLLPQGRLEAESGRGIKRGLEKFTDVARWWPTTSLFALSFKNQSHVLKRGQRETEPSQAVRQIPFSANKSLQNKYLNEKNEKKNNLYGRFPPAKYSCRGPWWKKCNAKKIDAKNKVRKKQVTEGEKFSPKFLWVSSRCLSTVYFLFSAKQVQSLGNTLSSARLANSGRKPLIFKASQHILVI